MEYALKNSPLVRLISLQNKNIDNRPNPKIKQYKLVLKNFLVFSAPLFLLLSHRKSHNFNPSSLSSSLIFLQDKTFSRKKDVGIKFFQDIEHT